MTSNNYDYAGMRQIDIISEENQQVKDLTENFYIMLEVIKDSLEVVLTC